MRVPGVAGQESAAPFSGSHFPSLVCFSYRTKYGMQFSSVILARKPCSAAEATRTSPKGKSTSSRRVVFGYGLKNGISLSPPKTIILVLGLLLDFWSKLASHISGA